METVKINNREELIKHLENGIYEQLNVLCELFGTSEEEIKEMFDAHFSEKAIGIENSFAKIKKKENPYPIEKLIAKYMNQEQEIKSELVKLFPTYKSNYSTLFLNQESFTNVVNRMVKQIERKPFLEVESTLRGMIDRIQEVIDDVFELEGKKNLLLDTIIEKISTWMDSKYEVKSVPASFILSVMERNGWRECDDLCKFNSLIDNVFNELNEIGEAFLKEKE